MNDPLPEKGDYYYSDDPDRKDSIYENLGGSPSV